MSILSLKRDRVGDRPRRCFVLVSRKVSSLIFYRYRLTPQQRQKLGQTIIDFQATPALSDHQYLIANRLREVAVLLREKRTQFANIQLRMQTHGPSPMLVRELTNLKEQMEDLLQLGDEWRNMLGFGCENPVQYLSNS